jgi:DNA-binding XRE family transcriptional regulator
MNKFDFPPLTKEKLKEMRKANGLKQEELAIITGQNRNSVGKHEKGDPIPLTVQKLYYLILDNKASTIDDSDIVYGTHKLILEEHQKNNLAIMSASNSAVVLELLSEVVSAVKDESLSSVKARVQKQVLLKARSVEKLVRKDL